MFGAAEKNKPRQQGPAHTLISRQTEILGDLRFNGELIIEDRQATITRASLLERVWTRATGDFGFMELCEFSFSEEVMS